MSTSMPLETCRKGDNEMMTYEALIAFAQVAVLIVEIVALVIDICNNKKK